ncbi:hypothetical protein [Mycobacterium uberis]|uniref:hypothetical protein n=1 Tax=Mycobacterium uberis TaxID=2162698 RepID=UPI001402732A
MMAVELDDVDWALTDRGWLSGLFWGLLSKHWEKQQSLPSLHTVLLKLTDVNWTALTSQDRSQICMPIKIPMVVWTVW